MKESAKDSAMGASENEQPIVVDGWVVLPDHSAKDPARGWQVFLNGGELAVFGEDISIPMSVIRKLEELRRPMPERIWVAFTRFVRRSNMRHSPWRFRELYGSDPGTLPRYESHNGYVLETIVEPYVPEKTAKKARRKGT